MNLKLTATSYFDAVSDYSVSVCMYTFFLRVRNDSERWWQGQSSVAHVRISMQNKYAKSNSSH